MHDEIAVRQEASGPASLYAGIALGLALVFFLLMASVSGSYNDNTAERDIKLLAPIAARRDTGDVTLVMLGNSRLRNAVAAVPEALSDGRRLWSVQYAQDVALFEAYEPLWPHILAAKPDYIVMQDALFTTDRRIALMSLAGFSNMIYGYLEKHIRGLTPEKLWRRDRGDIIDTCIRAGDYNRAAMQDRIIFAAYRDRHALGGANPNTEKARAAVRAARAAGIGVIILRLPPNEGMIARFGVAREHIDYYGLGFVPVREQLLPGFADKVEWFEYPAPGPESYCDFVHFNEKGRSAFTADFLSRL